MDPRRLALLLELSRRGSMREVAEHAGVSTSTVSQQLSVLADETSTVLIERVGRRVRLTPAGHRLARHAVTILAAIEAARADLDPGSEPAGIVRAASFATAARDPLILVAHRLRAEHPAVRLTITEQEPPEALRLLDDDEVDLALVYDYNLDAMPPDPATNVTLLGSTPWSLGVPTSAVPAMVSPAETRARTSAEIFASFADHDWVVNSRGDADLNVVRAIASLAGFSPRVSHRADSLDLVQDIIAAGLGVGLLPGSTHAVPGVELIPLRDPPALMRTYAVTRAGREHWPPTALVLRLCAAPRGDNATTA